MEMSVFCYLFGRNWYSFVQTVPSARMGYPFLLTRKSMPLSDVTSYQSCSLSQVKGLTVQTFACSACKSNEVFGWAQAAQSGINRNTAESMAMEREIRLQRTEESLSISKTPKAILSAMETTDSTINKIFTRVHAFLLSSADGTSALASMPQYRSW